MHFGRHVTKFQNNCCFLHQCRRVKNVYSTLNVDTAVSSKTARKTPQIHAKKGSRPRSQHNKSCQGTFMSFFEIQINPYSVFKTTNTRLNIERCVIELVLQNTSVSNTTVWNIVRCVIYVTKYKER